MQEKKHFDLKSRKKVIGKSPDQNQSNMFKSNLKQIINPKHSLVQLADRIPWQEFEKEYKRLYSQTGMPAKPIRLMTGLLILKQLKHLSDEGVVKDWVQNPYYQYFCGASEFQWEAPCDPSDLVHFRNRLGNDGVEKILEVSIKIQGDKNQQGLMKTVSVDTTAQEKNITYPTDVKLAKKIIEQCRKLARREGIELRQSYSRIVKELMLLQRFSHHPRNYKKAEKAKRKLKTIAGRLVREIGRKLPEERLDTYQEKLNIYQKVLLQKRHDQNKIYSLHEPQVACIAKGKAGKPFEFGSKVSVAMSKDRSMILGIVNYAGNPNDSKTLEDTLKKVEQLTGVKVEKAIVDRGYKVRSQINGTEIIKPKSLNGDATSYQKAKMRNYFRRRAAIEPSIGHLKNNFGLKRNFLKGIQGDINNAVLAGAAYNFKRWLNQKLKDIFVLIRNWTIIYNSILKNRLPLKLSY